MERTTNDLPLARKLLNESMEEIERALFYQKREYENAAQNLLRWMDMLHSRKTVIESLEREIEETRREIAALDGGDTCSSS